MKNRDYKLFFPDCYCHVFNRGNNKQDIFLDNQDFEFFLKRLEENFRPEGSSHVILQDGKDISQSEEYLIRESHTPYIRKTLPKGSFSLLSYILMPNHFHLELRQNTLLPISKLVSKVCTSYSIYFNKKYNHIGNVFQHPYKSIKLDSEAQLLWLSAYIHNNAKTAGLVENPEDYLWSSYLDYIGKRNSSICDKDFILKIFNNNTTVYRKFVEEAYYKIKERKDLQNLLLEQ